LSFKPIVANVEAKVVSVLGKDMTAVQAAAESRRFIANLVESSEDAIFAYGLDGRILTWNRGAEAIFGYTAWEAIGEPFAMLVLPEQLEEVDQFAQRIMQGETLHGRDGYGIRKDGGRLRVSVTSWALKNAEGAMEAISAIARDVTKQYEAEGAQRLLASIVESSSEAIHALDLEDRIVSWNSGAERLTGYTRAEAIGAHVGMMVPPADRPRIGPRTAAIKRGKLLEPIEMVVQRKDGSHVDALLSGSPIRDAQGNVVGTSAILHDNSESKELHCRLVEAERKYRAIFDGALEGMFQASFSGRIMTANAALARMLGYRTPWELITSVSSVERDIWVDPREYAAYMRELGEHKSVVGFECRMRRKDGTVFWGTVSCRRVVSENDRPLYREGSVQDISARKIAEDKLKESEALYRETFEQAAMGIAHKSFDGTILWCNARFAEITGYTREELVGLSVARLTPPEYLDSALGIIEPLVSGKVGSTEFEKPIICKDGGLRWAKVTVSTKRAAEGHPLHLISFVEDIQARKDAERELAAVHEELRLSEMRYRAVFETSRDSIGINRLSDGAYIDVNQALLANLGYGREEVIGRSSKELGIWAGPGDREKFVDHMRAEGSCSNQEVDFRRKDGTVVSCLISGSVIEIDDEVCIVSITRDISDAKAAEERIKSLASYDALTGLPNRRSLLERLRKMPHVSTFRRRKLALILVDLDNFKSLNDTLGHDAGDLLLQEVARRLTACVRKYDAVARVGGDEFAVMLDNLSESLEEAAGEARLVGEKIRALLNDPFRLMGHECHCSSSLGIDLFATEAEDAVDALQRAELAMFDAKAAGRNLTRFFAPAQQAAVNRRAALEEELRQAIKAEQFMVYYQPQVERGRVTGAEALIRWNHPSRGLVSPDDFIPVAEETGLILQVGEWVLETVCKQLAAWSRRRETAHLTVAANISARHLRQPDFVARVMAILKRTQANPESLRLELTESVLSHDVEDTVAKMNELKSQGVRFCLDDFGTGYSSLSYLKQLPLSGLKIDRAFVKDLLVDASSGAIAQAIISLGRALDLSVIAEGVETEEQRGYLAGLGCHSYQGYLYSPARPIMDFEAFLEDFEKKRQSHGRPATFDHSPFDI
jgi:diguanylate cyclase (GGDEF)-like protein/PAS domain S-box-containing protein